jgi:DNA-binding PadR family transcriptional regulator
MKVTFGMLSVLRELMLASDPMCGAELTRTLKIKSGTIYPMLANLKKEGQVELVATLPHPMRPPSHFYQATPKGRAHFLYMLSRLTIPDHEWRDQPPGVNEEYEMLRRQT